MQVPAWLTQADALMSHTVFDLWVKYQHLPKKQRFSLAAAAAATGASAQLFYTRIVHFSNQLARWQQNVAR